MKLSQILAAFVVAAVGSINNGVNAAPANPLPKVYYQPDGSATPDIWLRGNQLYNWQSDEKGYTIVRDEEGWYNYGTKNDQGDIISSGIKIGSRNPKKAGIAPGLLHDQHRRPASVQLGGDSGADSVSEHRSLLHVPESALCGFDATKDNPCKLKALVFLIQFNDHLSRKLPTKEEYSVLFNNNGPDTAIAPSGSVADVFFENSYETFVLESYVTPWLKVGRSEAQTVDDYYGLNRAGTKKTWTEAMTMFDNMNLINMDDWDVDGDLKFDCTVILHSGSPAESGGSDCENNKVMEGRIWSHATSSNLYSTASGVRVNRFYVASGVFESCPPGGAGTKWGIARVAVIAHECAHFLGLPDLYDTEGGQGVGTFDLLGNMWGWYGSQYYPPLMGAWCKMKLGWSNVKHVAGPGTHDHILAPACDNSEILYIDHRLDDGEYFLLEYRFPCGFDKEMSHHANWQQDRSGIAVWHIDESGQLDINYQSHGIQGQDVNHYVVAVVQGDGAFNMERELWANGNKGDRFDLFMNCHNYNCGKAKKISNSGLVMANGDTHAQPSTKGYGRGSLYDTGITIEVGPYAAEMTVTITLEGTDNEPNTFPGIDDRGNSIGDVPTPAPVSAPTPHPVLPPTPAPINPTPAPVDPTPAPTPLPTPAPVPAPTPAPVPAPTPAPVDEDLSRNGDGDMELVQPEFKHDTFEHEPEWESKFSSHGVVTDIDAYKNFYQITDEAVDYNTMHINNQQDELLNIPIDCSKKDNQFIVTYMGVGRNDNVKTKHCGWFVNQEKFCPILDQDPLRTVDGNRARIWQVCQQECWKYTNCHTKGRELL